MWDITAMLYSDSSYVQTCTSWVNGCLLELQSLVMLLSINNHKPNTEWHEASLLLSNSVCVLMCVLFLGFFSHEKMCLRLFHVYIFLQSFVSLIWAFILFLSLSETLRNYFSQYGEVVDCVIMKDKTTNQSRGFGFVKFKDPNCVRTVLETKPHNLDGRNVSILNQRNR